MLLAILLAVVGGVAGGLAGYRSKTPLYMSQSTIQLRPNRPHLLYQEGTSRLWAEFFGERQKQLLTNRNVIDEALNDKELKKAFETTGRRPPHSRVFLENLSVRSSGAHFIVVSYLDPDKKVAQTAVQALMDAYWKRAEKDSDENDKRAKLENFERNWVADRARILASISRVAPHGEAALREEHLFQQKELIKLRALLQDVRTQLQLLEAKHLEKEEEKEEGKEEESGAVTAEAEDGAGQPGGAAEEEDRRSIVEKEAAAYQDEMQSLEIGKIALMEPRVAEDLKKFRELLFRKAEWRKEYGPNNTGMRALDTEIKLTFEQMLDDARAYLRIHGSPIGEIQQIEGLRRQRRSLETSLKEREADALQKAQEYMRLRDLNEQLAEKEASIAEVREGIQRIRVESEAKGRIERPTLAFLPEVPYEDKRAQMGVVGGLGGAALGFGLILLIGLLDRRVRTTEDLKEQSSGPGLLGLLPEIPRDLKDQEQLEVAARCVHEIRALLQIRNRSKKGNVFCVTSPAPGTGKTTLSIALGLSFSASGANTLIVDLDLIGKGLTDRFNTMLLQKLEMEVDADEAANGHDSAESRRSLLQFLLLGDRGRFRREWSSAEFWALLEKAVERLGIHRVKENGFLKGVLVLAGQSPSFSGDERWESLLTELGMIDEDTPNLDSFLGSTRGVDCALSGDDLGGCVMPSGLPNLSLLPNCTGEGMLNTDLSPMTIGELIEAARRNFDTVILDTGPIPGSIEASMAAAQADGVLFTISRGEQRPLVNGALTHLQAIGARPAGLVFNRANRGDVKRNSRSYYSYSRSSANGGKK
jgi:Mrp family chromosome partitioning ATPase/uncharacterized protein involved in exopolysaccharide biosynthesis